MSDPTHPPTPSVPAPNPSPPGPGPGRFWRAVVVAQLALMIPLTAGAVYNVAKLVGPIAFAGGLLFLLFAGQVCAPYRSVRAVTPTT